MNYGYILWCIWMGHFFGAVHAHEDPMERIHRNTRRKTPSK